MSNLLKAFAGGAETAAPYSDDVFSTFLYDGNGSTQTITNGIDLAGEGGMVWIKDRTNAYNHLLFDTIRGATKSLSSNNTNAQNTNAAYLTSFSPTGFSVGGDFDINRSGDAYASWTFRQAPRFFDVVTYTGDGVAGRTIAHSLGGEVGMIIVKRTDSTGNWAVYHRANTANPETDYLLLNSTAATADDATYWNDTAPTTSQFTVGTSADVNANGATYVAYLFGHDTEV